MAADPTILTGPLLAAVSRSFYLSLRFLPSAVRREISLAYLLARATDTLADSAQAPVEQRLRLLEAFQHAVAGAANDSFFHESSDLAKAVPHPGEAELLRRLADVVQELAALEPAAQALIREVLSPIVRGQSLDLRRFDSSRPASLESAASLDEYTWLVAGCVGEFWSAMLDLKIPGWSRSPLAEMKELGRRYGQGLQLVNILRDLPADLASGRCYLPLDELTAAGFDGDFSRWAEQAAAFLTVRERWIATARPRLKCGQAYAVALRHWRLRFTADLPWRLGMATLDQVASSPVAPGHRARVSRLAVQRVAAGSALRALLGWR